MAARATKRTKKAAQTSGTQSTDVPQSTEVAQPETSDGQAVKCSICWDELPTTDQPRRSRKWVARPEGCDHHFCYTCLKRWVRTKTSCPVCRTRFARIAVMRTVQGEVIRTDEFSDAETSSSEETNMPFFYTGEEVDGIGMDSMSSGFFMRFLPFPFSSWLYNGGHAGGTAALMASDSEDSDDTEWSTSHAHHRPDSDSDVETESATDDLLMSSSSSSDSDDSTLDSSDSDDSSYCEAIRLFRRNGSEIGGSDRHRRPGRSSLPASSDREQVGAPRLQHPRSVRDREQRRRTSLNALLVERRRRTDANSSAATSSSASNSSPSNPFLNPSTSSADRIELVNVTLNVPLANMATNGTRRGTSSFTLPGGSSSTEMSVHVRLEPRHGGMFVTLSGSAFVPNVGTQGGVGTAATDDHACPETLLPTLAAASVPLAAPSTSDAPVAALARPRRRQRPATSTARNGAAAGHKRTSARSSENAERPRSPLLRERFELANRFRRTRGRVNSNEHHGESNETTSASRRG